MLTLLPILHFSRTEHAAHEAATHGAEHDDHDQHHVPSTPLGRALHFFQVNALPLLSGILVALVWVNVDAASYHLALDTPLSPVRMLCRWQPRCCPPASRPSRVSGADARVLQLLLLRHPSSLLPHVYM